MIPFGYHKYISIKTVILFVCLSVFLSGAVSFLMPKKYQSITTLMVMEPIGDRTINQDAEKIETIVETYSSILHSPDLLNRVIENLQLDLPPTKLTQEALSKKVKVKAVRNTRLIRISVTFKDREMAAKIAEEMALQCLMIHTNIITGEVQSSRAFFNEQLKSALEQLQQSDEKLSAFQKKVSVEKLQKQLATALDKMREYDMEYSYLDIEIKKTEALKKKAGEHLQNIPRDIVSLRTNTTSESPTNSIAQKQRISSKLQTLDRDVSELNPDEDEVQAKIKDIRDMTVRIRQQLDFGEKPDHELDRLESLINELPRRYLSQIDSDALPLNESENGTRKKSVTELNPIYQENEREVVNADLFLAQLYSKKENLQRIIAKNNSLISTLQNQLADLERENAQRWRDVDVSSDIYKNLVRKVDEINIDVAAKIGDIVVVGKPTVPNKAVSPNIKLNMAAAGLLALLLGVALIYLKSINPADHERSDP